MILVKGTTILDMENKNELMIAKVLTSLMETQRITFKKLSEATGVPSSTLKGWSAGGISPQNLTQLKNVCEFFSVSMEYLLWGKEESTSLNLDRILTEKIYSGWIKVSIETPVSAPINKKFNIDED